MYINPQTYVPFHFPENKLLGYQFHIFAVHIACIDYMSSLLSFRLFIFLSEVIYLFISEYYTITIIVLSIYTSKKENSKGEVILFTRAPIHSFGRRGELSIIRGLKDNSN